VSQAAISTLDPKEQSIDLKCTLLSHMAIMEESLGNPLKALEIATKGHDLRKTEEPQNRIILAWDQSNLGYTCNTANKHLESRAHFENARQKWAAMIDDGYINSPWPTVQKKNLGRCLVYLREYDEAEMLLLEATREFESHEPINWAMLA
jgi:tetratricopeptide (TPR) repeat protein